MTEQPGDTPIPVMSFLGSKEQHPEQVSCWITHTNARTHEIIAANLDRSPMYSGVIEGIGPRYCPSIEDKIHRFADKESHQVFLEPEGLTTHELYPNGISTSLPFDVQLQIVRSIRGMENAHIVRPGYAIEYDFFDPRDLRYSLETKVIGGLFFAGQINGTTGYEEAGAQGLLAGANAALRSQGKDSWCPRRDEAYIGVLVDDLITLGTQEPYRMFTSRAEYRLILREDNADLRLTEKGRELGLVDDRRWAAFEAKREGIEREEQRLKSTWVRPNTPQGDAIAERFGTPLTHEYNLLNLLSRPEIDYAGLVEITGDAVDNPPGGRAGGDSHQVRRLHRPPAGGNRPAARQRRYPPACGYRLPGDFRPVEGNPEQAEPGPSGNPRTGFANPRRHAGCDFAVVDPPEEACLWPPTGAERLMSAVTQHHADELARGADEPGVALDADKQRQLLAYLALLIKWNKAYNLTAVRDPDEMVSRHLLDSLSIVPYAEAGDNWLDVGSGGGMPGVPLAILFPQKRLTLLDSNGKKTRFLTQVKLELKLANLEVVHSRVEAFRPESPFDGIVSRAFSSLEDFANWTRHLGGQETRWLAMKGVHPNEELAALPADFRVEAEHALAVPGCQGQRHLLILRRTA